MDAVILAAGKGERLNGIMPRYWKPLLVVNGQPLVRSAVKICRSLEIERIVVVVAPQNAAPIADVLYGEDVEMIVQLVANGPANALLTGLRLVNPDSPALVLMGDNVLTQSDVAAVAAAEPYGVGVQQLASSPSASRFTRLNEVGGGEKWVEKTPIHETVHEITAWVGPITVSPFLARQHLGHDRGYEQLIGPHLGKIAPHAELIHVSSIDVGTPESVDVAQ